MTLKMDDLKKLFISLGYKNVETVIQYVREQRLQQTTLNGFSTDPNSN